jgi:sulfopyruvate decarboxylase subunit alpha
MAMKDEAVTEIITGLKEAGVNFVSLLPDSEFSSVQMELLREQEIRCVSVSNEAIGVGLCAGAWLSGKVPALLVPTSGLLVATWPLASICMAWGIPMILIIPFRGDIGDAHWVMRPYQYTTKGALELLQIPYLVVNRISEVKSAIVAARKSASGWLYPQGVLLTGEVIFS